MKTVTVSASKTYDVHIGLNLLKDAGQYIAAIKGTCTAAIISNETVWPLYGNILQKSLTAAGFQVIHHTIPDGEAYKNGNTYLELLAFLAENKITRSDMLIALGGGVVGDITGFTAATYLRGLDYVQIPTTLLAMVDSSVGGKTAIDLPQGKNLAGAFCQPKLVLCDTAVLQTLPTDIFVDGCAEVIKYGVLYDPDLFAHLELHGLDFEHEYVISRCVTLKRDVVAKDEFDNGERQKLNLGHTIGHAVEALSQFSLSHGRSVAIGMGIVTKAASALGNCSEDVYGRICFLLKKFTLPCDLKEQNTLHPDRYTAKQLYHAALSDKKRTGVSVNLIIPNTIGDCSICKTPITQLQAFIEKGLL